MHLAYFHCGPFYYQNQIQIHFLLLDEWFHLIFSVEPVQPKEQARRVPLEMLRSQRSTLESSGSLSSDVRRRLCVLPLPPSPCPGF